MLRWIVFIVIFITLGIYSLQAIKAATRYPWVYYAYMALSLFVLGNFIYQFTMGDAPGRVLSVSKSYAFGLLLAMLSFMLITIVFLFSEDIFRFLSAGYHKIFGGTKEFSLPQRRRFLSTLAMGIAALPFSALLYGMVKGKYNFKVLKYNLEFDDLPDSFDGYQITQISDVHSGSFDNREKIEYAISLINKQKSDVLLFTGDMVNNMAEEMLPWKDLFSTLSAKDGKFSVLGNHDYGDYVSWETEEAKSKNLTDLKKIQKEMGFDLLLNDSRYLQKGKDRIALVGVENWGRGGFKKAGDLKKAVSNIDRNDFKILMSHDPSHWEDQVLKDDYHYHLTLSGHTHGMQFGIEIPGWIKWSPAKWRYKYWAGVYEEMGQMINVNRGFGFLGYPGRVGIWPEITVITLKKRSLT
ncbi:MULTISPECIES: metallophosphoesterase [unclassified Arenibacter]|jgi:predicted MPP superfamily phosphohydrolase|uniref:metallophosphoesterase n=1 Tax=unclassified Arenibacter TaxID=2615047 RepID=UPI000E345FF8|nr:MULTISPECIES: metallophosphoesterase [unclassified Arenibacter]MCM4162653.1 phosphoesterase [Arenibacter sp. A80]RFT58219.1 metallophosphoesterase [Arenibacter sp. P308M17]